MGLLNFLKRKRRDWTHIEQAIPYGLEERERSTLVSLIAWRAEKYINEADPIRVIYFQRLLKQIHDLPKGDYIEMGTQYGGTAKIIWDLMRRDCKLYCCDTFQGFTQEDLDVETTIRPHGFTTESIRPLAADLVEREITVHRPNDGSLKMVPGRVPTTLAPLANHMFRFVHLDMDLYEPTAKALEWVWPRMVPGAVVIFHDYDALPTIKKAADEFLTQQGLTATPMGDRFGSAVAYKPLYEIDEAELRRCVTSAKTPIRECYEEFERSNARNAERSGRP